MLQALLRICDSGENPNQKKDRSCPSVNVSNQDTSIPYTLTASMVSFSFFFFVAKGGMRVGVRFVRIGNSDQI